MERRRRKTREAIVQSFVRLFFEDGYDAVSMGKIAAAADVGRSTLYTHFRRKEELLRASMDHHLNILADVVTATGQDALSRLMTHFWENRRRHSIFSPGACRDALAGALAELIEGRLNRPVSRGQQRPWRMPAAAASRLIADHQLNLLDRWMGGHWAIGPPAMAGIMQDSVNGLRSGLQTE